jgi:hypothetical protein
MAGLCAPLPTLRRRPYGLQRTARGRCESLLPHRIGLAPTARCRSPGALRKILYVIWRGLVFANPPWSERRRAVVPWLLKFFAHGDGGIFLCVARTSADWFQDIVLAQAELLAFPSRKTRFHKPDGSLGPEPTNGICLIAKGETACAALRGSGLGYCLTVDRTAVSAAAAQDQLALAIPRDSA